MTHRQPAHVLMRAIVVIIATLGLVGMHQMSSMALGMESPVAPSSHMQMPVHEHESMTHAAQSEQESVHCDAQGTTSENSCHEMTHGCASTINAEFTLPVNANKLMAQVPDCDALVSMSEVIHASGDPPDLHALSISRT